MALARTYMVQAVEMLAGIMQNQNRTSPPALTGTGSRLALPLAGATISLSSGSAILAATGVLASVLLRPRQNGGA
jgi:hypothetical protein